MAIVCQNRLGMTPPYMDRTISLLLKSEIFKLLRCFSVCVGPGQKPRGPVFSRRGSVSAQINRIHHGWSVEIGKPQPECPSVPVGNEARRVSHWNDRAEFPTETMDPRVEIFFSPLNTTDGFFFLHTPIRPKFILPVN